MAEAKEKRVRKPRRNYEKELNELRTYCEASRDTLKSVDPNGEDPRIVGMIDSLANVLAKINGGQS